MTIGKRVGRHHPRTGWNASSDPEFRMRLTLSLEDRNIYDGLTRAQQLQYVQRFIREEEMLNAGG